MKLNMKKIVAMMLALTMIITSLTPSTAQAADVNHKHDTVKVEQSGEQQVVAIATAEVSAEDDVEDVIKETVLDSNEVTSVDVSECDMTQEEAEKVTEEVLADTNMEALTTVTYTTNEEGTVEAINVQTDSTYAKAAAEIEAIAEDDETSEVTKEDVQSKYAELQSFYEANPDWLGVPVPFFTEKGPINSILSVVAWGMTMDYVGMDFDGDGVPELSLDTVYMVVDGYLGVLQACIYGMDENGTGNMKEAITAARESALATIDENMSTEEKLLALNDWLANWCVFDMAQMEADPNAEKTEQENFAYMIETTLFGALVGSDYVFSGQTNPKGMCISYTAAYTYLVQWAFPEIYKNADDGSWKTKEELNETELFVYDEEGNLVYEDVPVQATDDEGNLLYEADGVTPIYKTEEVEVTKQVAKTEEVVVTETVIKTDADGNPIQAKGADGNLLYEEDGETPIYETEEVPVQAKDADGNLRYEEDGETPVYETKTVEVKDSEGNVVYEDVTTTETVTVTEKVAKTVENDPTYMIDFVEIKWDSTVTMLGEEKNFTETHFFNAVNIDGSESWYYIDPCYNDIYVECMGRNRVETDGNMTHSYFLISHTSLAEQFDGNYEGIDTLYYDEETGTGAATDTKYEDAWFTSATGQIDTDGEYYYYVTNSSIEDANVSDSDFNISDLMNGKDQLVAVKRNNDGTFNLDAEKIVLLDFSTFEGTTTDGTPISGDVEFVKTIEELEMDQHYSSVAHTAAYDGNGKLYFNVGNIIFTFELATGVIEKYKEYNTVTALQDTSVAFVGMSFNVVTDYDPTDDEVATADETTDETTDDTTTEETTEAMEHTVVNRPIAALSIKSDGKLYVSIATNFTKASLYQYEETNYNSEYVSYGSFTQGGNNDNDEFLWSANFVEALDLDCDHNFEIMDFPATCTEPGFSEGRCTKCGASSEVNKSVSDTELATGHHYVEFNETYYTKDDEGNAYTGTSYVCVKCLDSQETLPEGATLDHALVENEYTWAEDNSACTVTLVCATCADKKLDCVVDDTTNTQELDCDISVEYPEGYSCAEGGTVNYVASWEVDEETTGSSKKEVTLEAGEHAYVAGEPVWAEDHSSCEVTFTCEACGTTETLKDEEIDVVVDTKETCTEPGITTYTAVFTIGESFEHAVVEDVEVPATGHTYGEDDIVWSWDETYSSATATFTCATCETVTTVEDVVVNTARTEATCTEDGSVVHTASCELDGVAYSDEVVEVLAATGHDYEATFDWSDDKTLCYATVECKVCGDSSEGKCQIVEVATEPTCTEDGTVGYVAQYTYNGVTFEDNHPDATVTPATGHAYGEPVFTWGGYDACNAAFTCATCGHTEDVTCDITSVTTEPTCTEDGKVVYTATCTLDEETYTDSKEEVLEATGHTYKATFVWTEDRSACEATISCEDCDLTEKVDCTITSEGEEGDRTFTATCEYDGQKFTDSVAEFELPFTDVNEDLWYYEPIKYVYLHGLMTGRDETTFSPDMNLTRAQFAMIFYRIAGEPEVEYEAVFPDVPDNLWYTDAVMWAQQNGIVTGYESDGTFRPENNITREQMALMMYRYANSQEYDTSKTADYADYADGDTVSPWAEEGMSWAVGNGIITGKDKEEGKLLDPQGNATRAECATVIQRFCETYGE